MRLTIAGGLLFACNFDQSSSDEEQPEEPVTPPASSTLPSSPSSSSSSSSSQSSSSSKPGPASDAGGTADASSGTDGGKKTDAGSDAAKDGNTSPLVPFGGSCLLSIQCATGLCLPFQGKGLRCTKICNDDDDCPNNNDCGDNPRVCEID